MPNQIPPVVLSIAGTDPTGGAGIQADLKAISATGGYAATVITAVVAQNTQGVQAMFSIPADFVIEQIKSVVNDLEVKVIKIGMLPNAEVIHAVADFLDFYPFEQLVIDPVMVAKDGSLLFPLEQIVSFKQRLLPLATVITPNLFEAEKLGGDLIKKHGDMERVARTIAQQYRAHCFLKGGHLNTVSSDDVLCNEVGEILQWFREKRIHTQNTHGTGCTLSAAIASYLAQGIPMMSAIFSAKTYLTQAIQSWQHTSVGKGNGPVNHFYRLETEGFGCEVVF